MRVFSTFSGISAATVAWRELGWQMAGYAEINANACAILAARCGATRPKYLADPDDDAIAEAAHALSVRLATPRPPSEKIPRRLLSYLKPGDDPTRLTERDIRDLWHLDNEKFAEKAIEERLQREKIAAAHRQVTYAVTGNTPNFGDIWYITDDDLEELGPIDLLEGGSPCQAFSAAGKGDGMLDHRSALVFGFLYLIERMKQINGLKWVVWENVKGVLSDEQNGFGFLLGGIAKTGGNPVVPERGRYSNAGYVSGPDGDVAWRLLDAQHFGVPQRRERVFALARVGNGPSSVDPREILFDPSVEGWRAPTWRSTKTPPLGVPAGSADEVCRHRGPVVFMAGQGAAAYSAAESTTIAPTLRSGRSGTNQVPSVAYVRPREVGGEADYIVRKLMPSECERLQGFPDGWTAVEINGRPLSDAARQECIGNSMAVDVMRWLGRRLDEATMASAADGTQDVSLVA